VALREKSETSKKYEVGNLFKKVTMAYLIAIIYFFSSVGIYYFLQDTSGNPLPRWKFDIFWWGFIISLGGIFWAYIVERRAHNAKAIRILHTEDKFHFDILWTFERIKQLPFPLDNHMI